MMREISKIGTNDEGGGLARWVPYLTKESRLCFKKKKKDHYRFDIQRGGAEKIVDDLFDGLIALGRPWKKIVKKGPCRKR
jgi:hypothetical protein